ncbi:GT-D fold domain-containing glycosyltransferase [Lactobacillus amylovorus]|uniref:GT-D fold domain-containing glycosyltransferase n=1 Tax=Lactobacillus amylovorus TaxID=1604 RepID=UPI001CCB1299|nr:GT-D fold domain-containing glycosyltransferase [Lactobacillus amylovorus]
MSNFKDLLVEFIYNLKFKITKRPQVYSINDTLAHILDTSCSVSRYGDGEIKWIYDISHPSFQEADKEMGERLKEILFHVNEDNDRLIICIPEFFNGLQGFNDEAKKYYERNFIRDGKLWKPYVSENMRYYNADITRPYIDYKNKENSKEYFRKWKEIFNDRNILLVEGESTQFGVGNDFLDSARSVQRIICPSENAFKKYNEIKNAISNNALKIDSPLVLISLGPTATILSYELSSQNMQLIDIGHTDLEYEWYLKKALRKVPVKGRVVNELGQKSRDLMPIKSQQYESEIIEKIL